MVVFSNQRFRYITYMLKCFYFDESKQNFFMNFLWVVCTVDTELHTYLFHQIWQFLIDHVFTICFLHSFNSYKLSRYRGYLIVFKFIQTPYYSSVKRYLFSISKIKFMKRFEMTNDFSVHGYFCDVSNLGHALSYLTILEITMLNS